jgi:hypothetical protein
VANFVPLCDDAVVLDDMDIPLDEKEGVVYEDDQVEEEENVDKEDVEVSEEDKEEVLSMTDCPPCDFCGQQPCDWEMFGDLLKS